MLPQVVVNAIITSSTYLLVGLGFSLIYSSTKFFHFTHAAVLSASAYAAFVFSAICGFPFWLALPLAVGVGATLGGLLDIGVYGPLRHRGASSLVLLIASLGLYIVLQNTLSIAFGDAAHSLDLGAVPVVSIGLARVTLVQTIGVLLGLALVLAVALILKTTRMGKALRAVSCDAELAEVSGVNSNRVILWSFVVGSGLAAVAGVVMAADVAMTPTMGLNVMMMGIVAMIIGGLGSMVGLAGGAAVLGVAQHFGALVLGAEWQEVIAFAILLGFLLVRPWGFGGKKSKTAAV